MAKFTEKELQDKFKDLLKEKGSLICTEDGQAFYNTPEGKKFAQNHAAVNKVKFFEVKAAKEKTTKKTTTKKTAK